MKYIVYIIPPVSFDSAGLFNPPEPWAPEQCVVVIGLNTGTGTTIFTPTFFTGNTANECLQQNVCPTPTVTQTTTQTITPTVTRTPATTTAGRYTYFYYLVKSCTNESDLKYFNVVTDFPVNGVVFDPETGDCYKRIMRLEAPRDNKAPNINSWFYNCDTCYSNQRVARPTITPTASHTQTPTITSTPVYRLRLAKSCCNDQFFYVNAPYSLQVGTIAKVGNECIELFETLRVGPFYGYEYITETTFQSCLDCVNSNSCYSTFLAHKCNDDQTFKIFNVSTDFEPPFSVIFEEECWLVVSLLEEENTVGFDYITIGFDFGDCELCNQGLTDILIGAGATLTPTPNQSPTTTPTQTLTPSVESNIICLSQTNTVYISAFPTHRYIFVPGNYNSEYRVSIGTYVLMNIPFAHPIAFQNQFVEGFTYTGQYLKGTKVGLDGNVYSYYYGNVTITVTQPFFRISYECWNHGYMGGRDNLGYLEDCATIVPSASSTPQPSSSAPQPSSTDYPSVTASQTSTPNSTSAPRNGGGYSGGGGGY